MSPLKPESSREVVTSPERDQAPIRTRLANERTFLAYMRTALTFLVAGIAFLKFWGSGVATAIGWVFMPCGGVMFILGVVSYWRVRKLLTAGSAHRHP